MEAEEAMYSAKSLQMIRAIIPRWRHCIFVFKGNSLYKGC